MPDGGRHTLGCRATLGWTYARRMDANVIDTGPESSVEEPDELVEEELLVEEISIDGMCGVY